MTTLTYLQFFVVRAVLMFLEPEIPYSVFAEQLVLGTAAHESHLGKLVRGHTDLLMYQMEAKTEEDIWKNFMPHHPALSKKVHELKHINSAQYAAAMVRVHYFRNTEDEDLLYMNSDSKDVDMMARLWKKHYNTRLGKGTIGDFKVNYYRIIEGRTK